MADLGYIALFLALLAAVYSAVTFVIGRRNGAVALVGSARNGLLATFGLVSVAVAALLIAILTHDFQIEYVASESSRSMSWPFLVSGLWAGNQGSMLFWAWVLSAMAAIVILQKRDTGKELLPYAAAIMMTTEAFFLAMLIVFNNPFHKLGFAVADGRGLNPLLQNPGMLFHPPSLLAGYVAFTVPFAFAMAALLTRRLSDEWILSVRRWTIAGWLFLGIGNIIGAWWAYVELGWGGYWMWDPVENASLMPWLTGTAFLHSIMMQRRRGILKVWNMFLIIVTFSLSIFGTYLTRSGILDSVHAFGDNTMGPYFAAFLLLVFFGSLALLFYRADHLKSDSEMESLVSRESTFLMNNILLLLSALVTFGLVISPLIFGLFGKKMVPPSRSYYDVVNGPIFLGIILLAGLCALIGWRRASAGNLRKNFLWPFVATVVLGAVLFVLGSRHIYALIAFLLCAFVILTILYEWVRGTLARHKMRGENYFKAFFGLLVANRPRYGGYFAHIGIALIAIGVIGQFSYNVEKEVTLRPGESVTINQYNLVYESRNTETTPTRTVDSATLSVFSGGRLLGQMRPTKFNDLAYDQSVGQPQTVTQVAIRSNPAEDLYVILLGWDPSDTATSFKVIVNPLVDWLWIGGIVMVLGGVMAWWPQRQKLPLPPPAESRNHVQTAGQDSARKK